MGRQRSRRNARQPARARSDDSVPTPADAAVDPPRRWIQGLADVVRMTQVGNAAALRTSLSCHLAGKRCTLFVPPEMPSLQPRSLRYLHRFAERNACRLVEDRRQNRVSPLIEQRDGKPPAIALGVALLLKQCGLPGATPLLSRPHRLSADSPLIDLPELIALAAHAVPKAKRVVLLPNKPLVEVMHEDTQPLSGFAWRMDSAPAPTVLSHFEGPSFRTLGYSSGGQYVLHVLLAGGPASAPTLWAHPDTLTRTDLRFRLFRGRRPEDDFGLLHSTFYYDMASRETRPWWLANYDDRQRATLDAVG